MSENLKEMMEAGKDGIADTARKQQFEASVNEQVEDHKRQVDEAVEALEQFDGNIISTLEAVLKGNHALSSMLEDSLIDFMESWVEGTNLNEVAETEKQELDNKVEQITDLRPGNTIVFTDGEYEGLTGEVRKIGVSANHDLIAVDIHQEPYSGNTVFIGFDKIEKIDRMNDPMNDDDQTMDDMEPV
jgi:hypothetical protein